MIRLFSKWRIISVPFEERIYYGLKFEYGKKGYSCDKKSQQDCISQTPKLKHATENNKLKPRSLVEVSNLDCKTTVVIGGEEGIGYAAAHELLSNKAKIVGIFGKNECKGMQACHALNCRFGKGKAIFFKVDVNSKTDIECAIYKLSDQYGRIEAFVHTVAICDGQNWENELKTNLIGMTRCTIAAHKYLSESKKGGVIINSSGIFGMMSSAGCPTISAAQHGIIGLSKSFGKDALFKHTKVRVIALCPGITETKLFKRAKDRALTEFQGKCFQEEIGTMKKQKPEACGSAIVWLIRYGDSGSVWMITGGELYKFNHRNLPYCCSEWYMQFTA